MNRASLKRRLLLRKYIVWILRLLTGGVFMLSGWAKCVDINGFCLKLNEYLAVLGTEIPSEIVLIGAAFLCVSEFVIGVCLASASLRRVSVWCAIALMAFMLPLTLWLWISNPISDCGCFGDLFTLSNGATFAKNVIITSFLVVLLFINRKVQPFLTPAVQWLAIIASCFYAIYICVIGYQIQPLVDFRPYKVGTQLYQSDLTSDEKYVYSLNGKEEIFTLENLPDSTWTFVGSLSDIDAVNHITVTAPDGEDVTEDFAAILNESPTALLLVVSDPETQFLTRTHYLQDLHNYLLTDSIEMFALVGGDMKTFERWQRLTHPNFQSFLAEDTSLKMLVRGTSGLVYLKNGEIIWKRTLGSLSPDFPYTQTPPYEALEQLSEVPYALNIWFITGCWLAAILFIFFLGKSPKMLAFLKKIITIRQKFAKTIEK